MKFTKAVTLHKQGSVTKKLDGSNLWVVTQEFVWYVDYETKTEKIVVPVGFEFDFGSIPRILRPVINPTGWLSFVLHDKMYVDLRKRLFLSPEFREHRKKSDIVMLESLIVAGMPKRKAIACFLGVRAFGAIFVLTGYIKGVEESK